ncbi:hypothetical protein D8674_002121 [Pyrus ussuriensis x Pyrus communis]|uniref:Uncharacterized protein n=1 Tax=Pyrus ussuriensis x Pyrus communis TaxID=2448454 RepID=A0A5N5FDC3_9ROSA|nr:hypothetical protein D8674_002121 [Pyrus ussuriensis x Pyrus communis]
MRERSRNRQEEEVEKEEAKELVNVFFFLWVPLCLCRSTGNAKDALFCIACIHALLLCIQITIVLSFVGCKRKR